jgi:hypothetical protein
MILLASMPDVGVNETVVAAYVVRDVAEKD